jgi:hypothetical protein
MTRPLRSFQQLEDIASRLRSATGLELVKAFDVIEFIERLSSVFPGLKLVTVSDGQLPHAEAEANCSTNTILCRESLYIAAVNWTPRARMILAEEVSHIALGHVGPRCRREVGRPKAYTRAEQQDETEARRLAAILLAPTDLTNDCHSVHDVVGQFFLSRQAAEIRWEEVQRSRRLQLGERRKLPLGVIDFLREQKRKGYPVTTPVDDD